MILASTGVSHFDPQFTSALNTAKWLSTPYERRSVINIDLGEGTRIFLHGNEFTR